MEKFNIGDFVLIKQKGLTCSLFGWADDMDKTLGKIGKIISKAYRDGYVCYFENIRGMSRREWSYAASDLEPIADVAFDKGSVILVSNDINGPWIKGFFNEYSEKDRVFIIRKTPRGKKSYPYKFCIKYESNKHLCSEL